jgi:protein-S-isoprenylcysteine O-methyltransferase Ste14
MDLQGLRAAALAALLVVVVAYADTPLRTLGRRFRAHRWAERLVLLSIELNLVLLWAMTRLVLGRDAPLAPESAAPVLAAAGAALAWAGAGFAVWARVALGRWFTGSFAVHEDHALVTRGPYAVVRHPMYLALVALLVGLGVAWNSLLTVGLALLLVVPFVFHTAIEEPMLAAHFGDAWRAYARRVPRLVPGWRVRGG